MFVGILLALLFIFLNGFFISAEFALMKVRTSQLDLKVQAGSSTASLAKRITERLDRFLIATQLGITMSSLALGWIGGPVVSQMLLDGFYSINIAINETIASVLAFALTFTILTILHLVFGGIVPKSIAAQKAESTLIVVAYPLRLFYWIFSPFIWLLNVLSSMILKILGFQLISEQETYTQEELRYLIEQVKEQAKDVPGDSNEETTKLDIIKNAFEFSERTARQIMVPRTHMVAIDINDYDSKTIEHVIEEDYTRIPCYEDSIDNIVGMVRLKDILKELRKKDHVDIKSILRPISFIPETKRIGLLLSDFQKKHQQIAMVVNEYGGVEGLITMEDILEELVGEIQDESDNEIPFVEKINDNLYHILATAAITDINDELSHPIDKEKQYDTLAGYLIDKFGRIPMIKESLVSDDYQFTILKKAKTSIVLVEAKDLLVEDESAKIGVTEETEKDL